MSNSNVRSVCRRATSSALLAGSLLLCGSATAAVTINFDTAADGAVIDTFYQLSNGVTFANPLGGNIFARSGVAISPPNLVNLLGTGVPGFDAKTGAVDATFSTTVASVSIDTYPFVAIEAFDPAVRRPFLEAYDAAGTLLSKTLYTGPLPNPSGLVSGPTETLTVTSTTNNIKRARFSSQFNQFDVVRTYAAFDNLTFAVASQFRATDGFDSETSSALSQWKTARGSVDLVTSGSFGITCFGSTGKCLDLDGGTQMAGRLESLGPLDLPAGTYTLSFAISGNQRGGATDSVTVSLANYSQTLYTELFTRASADPWQVITRTINVASHTSGKLIFDHSGGFGASDNIGIVLDQVQFNPSPPTQGPSSTILSDGSALVASYAADPSLGSASLGAPQMVCLNSTNPANCQAAATLYNRPGAGWTANLNTPASCQNARWIWAPGTTANSAPSESKSYYFTQNLVLNSTPSPTATLYIAADDFAEVFVNGVFMGSTGSVTNSSLAGAASASLKAIPIAALLHTGSNLVKIHAVNGPGSFAGCTNCTHTQNPAGVVFCADLGTTSAPAPASNWLSQSLLSSGLLLFGLLALYGRRSAGTARA